MPPSITWAHVGDFRVDAADGWLGTRRLAAIIEELNGLLGRGVDFVFLPGGNASHGRPEEYRRILDALAPLSLPWRATPGDHNGRSAASSAGNSAPTPMAANRRDGG